MISNIPRNSKLLWRSRRGSRELDSLLLPFVRNHIKHSGPYDLSILERFLEISDPVLIDWLLGNSAPKVEEFSILVKQILEFSLDHKQKY